LVIGMVIFISPVASALLIVGDPIPGNSFSQSFYIEESDGPFDTIQLSVDGGELKGNGLTISDSNWNIDMSSATLVSATSTDIAQACLFGASLAGDLDQDFVMTLKTFIRGVLAKMWLLRFYGGRFSIESVSVPDADIMWLLGPALIGLGLIGRKKYKTIRQ